MDFERRPRKAPPTQGRRVARPAVCFSASDLSRLTCYQKRDHGSAARIPRLTRQGADHRRVALLQRRSRRRRVLHLLEEVRVDPERRRRARLPELAGDEHRVEALGDEEGGESVTQRVEGEPARAGEPRRRRPATRGSGAGASARGARAIPAAVVGRHIRGVYCTRHSERRSIASVRAKELLRRLRRLGCAEERQRGSHVRVRCGKCVTTVPVHAGENIGAGLLRAIERDLEPCLGSGWLRPR